MELQVSDALIVSGQVGLVLIHQLHATRPEKQQVMLHNVMLASSGQDHLPGEAVDGWSDHSARLSHHFHPPAIVKAFASTSKTMEEETP